MDNNNKRETVKQLLQQEKQRYGSYNRLSRVLGVSNATISNMLNDKWNNISDEIINKVMGLLMVQPAPDWVVVETFNIRQMFQVINTARSTRSFWAVSHKAGSGKTAAIRLYAQRHQIGVYAIQAHEWTARQFLSALCRNLGIEPEAGYNSISMMLEQTIEYFMRRSDENPILMVDEADKLKDSAKRIIIPLFNRLEDRLACIWAGTDNLEFEIKKGVRSAKKGFDEIDSRFGRTYIGLTGATIRDCELICNANGIIDKQTVSRIFAESRPISTVVGGINAKVVEDMRRIKRLIIAEKALNNTENQYSMQFTD